MFGHARVSYALDDYRGRGAKGFSETWRVRRPTIGNLSFLDHYRAVSRGQLPRGPNSLARALLWTLQQVADYLRMA